MKRLSRIAAGSATLLVALSYMGCSDRSEPTSPGRNAAKPVGGDPLPLTPSTPPTPPSTMPVYPTVIIAQYDLQQVGDQTLPLDEAGGGSSWLITGGHYYLGADSTYAFGYDVNGQNRPAPIGRYVWIDATTVKFYLAPGSYPMSSFYKERGGLFSTGRINGGTMTVTYEDFVDFEIEKYTSH